MTPDLVIVGGGIAGASLATVLARRGLEVVVLERQRVHRDRVRGEYIQPWGVAELQRLDLTDVFERAGGIYPRWSVPYDETRPPEVADASKRDMSGVLPGVQGPLCAGHPAACEALLDAANEAGARALRGIDNIQINPGTPAAVEFDVDGTRLELRTRLVIGADGRKSSVRAQSGITLHQAPATHLVAGMLVDGVPDWPQDTYSIGTQGDVMYFVFPQANDRVRLYFCTALDQRDRFAGPEGQARFLETFRTIKSLPFGEAIANGSPIGPCATLTGEDTWTNVPLHDGVALIGDAAGYNDPIIGEGLSLALRDVRALSELLLENSDWSVQQLMPYAEERRERMRRMRFTATLVAALASEFGPAAAARRKRFGQRLQAGGDPELKFALGATALGPDNAPDFAFDESMRQKVLR